MSDFPATIHTPRTIENRTGVVYDANNIKTLYAEDLTAVNDEVVAIENALGVNLGNMGLNGWQAIATIPILQSSDDPVYVLRFGADMTAILAVGQKIKLTQNGSVKYFIIVAMGGYLNGNTEVTVYGGTDYDMVNTTTYPVTVPYYSIQKAPFGFPLNPTKWTVIVTDATERNQASPTQDTWYNLGSVQISIPIGVWDVDYYCSIYCSGGTTGCSISSLSIANNSRSDADFDCMGQTDNSGITTPRTRRKILALASKTVYYLIEKVANTSAGTLRLNASFNSDQEKTIIRAVCTYL